MDDIEVEKPEAARHAPRPLSSVLEELAEAHSGRDITVRAISSAMADRSFATFLVITSLMNMLPFPPGSTLILGIPIIIVAMQMVVGRETVWLPQFFLKRTLKHETFSKVTTKIIPNLRKIEKWIRPRKWPFATNKRAERIVGLFAVILGVAVFLPVPLGNWLPALACAFCGLALSERDGVWLAFGVFLGLLSIAIIFGVLATASIFAFSFLGT